MTIQRISRIGLVCALTASVMFGVTPLYLQWLAPLSGMELFWGRIVFSTLFALIFSTLMKQWPIFIDLIRNPRKLGYLTVGTLIVAFQWWIFIWSPVNGLTKELSLGYYLLPLTLTLTGRLVYQETIRPFQKLAIGFAVIGIAHEIWAFGSLSWVPVGIAGLYPFYFIIRRKVQADTLVCFLFENLLLLPVALLALLYDPQFSLALDVSPQLLWLLPGLGILSSSAMLIYVSASKRLPVSLFGLLSYIEPTMLFAIAVLIMGEPMNQQQWLTYGFIGLASILVCIDSARMVYQPDPAT